MGHTEFKCRDDGTPPTGEWKGPNYYPIGRLHCPGCGSAFDGNYHPFSLLWCGGLYAVEKFPHQCEACDAHFVISFVGNNSGQCVEMKMVRRKEKAEVVAPEAVVNG